MESIFRLTRKNIGRYVDSGGAPPADLVNLLPVDSEIPNLALEKVAYYFRAQGRTIVSDWARAFDGTETWASVVFTSQREKFRSMYDRQRNVRMGGSGWDLTTKLPDEIERINPKINLGFTTRGCIRKCKFCVVPSKEGRVHPVGDIYDLWDREARHLTLLDNNVLGAPEHFKLIVSQLVKEKLSVDFNQGLDIRLVDDQVAYLMSKIRFPKFPRFALDSVKLIPTVRKKLKLLRKYRKGSRYFFYVLVGFDSTFEEDLERLNYLRSEGVQAYVMRFEKDKSNKMLNRLANWVNSMASFRKYTFEEYVRLHDQHNKYSEDSPIVQLRKKFLERGKA